MTEREIDEYYDILEAEPAEEVGAPTPGAEKSEIVDSVIIELIRGEDNDS